MNANRLALFRTLQVIVILALALSVSTTVSAAPASPFLGHWTAADTDGSAMTLNIGGPPTGPFQLTWTDDYISYCAGGPGMVRGTGWLNEADTNLLEADVHLECFTTGDTLDFHVTFRYHPATNKLSLYYFFGQVTIWSRPGRPEAAPPAMNLRVNYGHDWVESFYEGGHTAWVTVTDGDGNLKATAELVTEPKDFWGGETGFQTTPEGWVPGPPDIQPNDWVYGWVDNGASAQVQIGDISGAIDLETDSITGTVLAPWFSDPVQVECLDWGSGQDPPFDNKDGGSILADGLAAYSCSWFGEWDIQPGQTIGVGYFGPDSHWVANAFSIPNPTFVAYLPVTIVGYDWPMGDTIAIDINDGEYTAEAQVGNAEWDPAVVLFELWRDGFSMEAGDHIVMTEEVSGMTKEVWVTNLAVTDFDLNAEKVFGTYDPAYSLWVWLYGFEGQVPETDPDAGTWTATFAELPPGALGGATQWDEDGDGTSIDFQVPNPRFVVFPEWEWFDGLDWPDGETVTITVEGKPECTTTKESWGGFFNGSFGEGCDVVVDNVVTFTDGETVRTHTVRNLAITSVDEVANTVAGTADTGEVVYAWVHSYGYDQVLQVADGAWLADFGSAGLDLVGGMSGRAEIRDEFGNATAVDWSLPTTFFISSTEDVRADDGFCTLREAVIAANTNSPSGAMQGECPAGLDDQTDNIVLAAGQTYSLTLDSTFEDGAWDGDLDLWDNSAANDLLITVEGGGFATISQDAAVDDRVLENHGATVHIEGLTLTGGSNVEIGGGVHNAGGTLIMKASTVSGNTALVHGGGLWNSGTLTVEGGAISSNAANDHGGGLGNSGMATIQGAVISGNSAVAGGGGVVNFDTGTLAVTGGTISGNSAGWGGGIVNTGTLNLTDASVSDNTSSSTGGAIQNTGTLTLTGSTVSGNSASESGGGLFNDGGTLTVEASLITGNTASVDGGGLLNGGTLTVDASILSANSATWGGGAIFTYTGDVTIQNGSVLGGDPNAGQGNTANYGGGIAVWSGSLVLNDSTVSGNTVTWVGGAIRNVTEGTVTVNSSTITGNSAEWDGGGILNEGSMTLYGSEVSNNTAVFQGGGIGNWEGDLTLTASTVSGNSSGDGGGAVNWPNSTLTIDASTFADNTAGGGGGLRNQGTATITNGSQFTGNTAGWMGGAINNDSGGMLLVEGASVISGNSSDGFAGGLHNDTGSTLTVTNSSIANNVSVYAGGGIRNDGSLTVGDSVFSANTSSQGGALYNAGTAEVSNSTFGGSGAGEGNTGTDGGGGLFNTGTMTVDNTTVTGNSGFYGGGLFNWIGGMLTISNSTVSNNSANGGGGLHNKEDSTTVIQNSVFAGNYAAWAAGAIENWGTITITGSVLRDNDIPGEAGDAIASGDLGTASITGSCIVGNGDTAVFTTPPVLLSATGNWWGDPSGPSGFGPGSGDSVSEYVDFSGWLTEPPPICAP
jgi:hypothetical protein